jgi:glycosyltransferase involved in cell wall biosynthesis
MQLHLAIISSLLHPRYGGPSSVIRMHFEALKANVDITVFGCTPKGGEEDLSVMFPTANVFPETWPRRWYRGRGLHRALGNASSQFDIFHAHMLWDHPTWATWRVARKTGKPLVVTPHGSLSAEWRTNSIHKRIYRLLVLEELLRYAGALHVVSEAESEACRLWGFNGRIKVIPNGLPLSEFERVTDPEAAWREWPSLKNKRVMLYLGRLWWQKGLDILPEVWMEAQPDSDWMLVIAGPDYRSYRHKLDRKIKEVGSNSKILLAGLVADNLKRSLLAASECLILPSYGEGFSMALVEAMAAGLPCIFTKECHLPELASAGGGWEVAADKKHLVEIVEFVCRRSRAKNKASGDKGRELGYSKYTTDRIGKELLDLYREFT